MGTLFVVATPIGNLDDMTIRAKEVLSEVDFILCEDTRHTMKLLRHYEIAKPLISYHQHSKVRKTDKILELLREGKSLALVSDAGTPGISDPGNALVEKVREELGEKAKIVTIPGASAVLALAQVSGLPTDKFLFLGFIPQKKGRKKILKAIVDEDRTVIFYESPYRILKTLTELKDIFNEKNIDKKVVVGRELTKTFETIYYGSIDEVIEQVENDKVKGEFVVAVGAGSEQKTASSK